MNVRVCTKGICYFTITIIIVFTLIIGGAFLWLVTGKREVPFFKETVTQLTTTVIPGYTVQVGKHHLTWDGWRNALQLRAYDISIKNASDHEVAFIPDVSVGFNMFHLLYGRVAPNKMSVNDPEIRVPYTIPIALPSSEKLTDSSNALYPHVVQVMSLLADTQRQHVSLKRLNIANANIIFNTAEGKQFTWHIDRASGRVTSQRERNLLHLDISSEIYDTALPLEAELSLSRSQFANFKLRFNQLMPKVILADIPESLLGYADFLKHSDLTMSGWFGMSFNGEGNTQLTELHIESGQGMITAPGYFEYNTPLTFLTFDGSVSEDFSLINIDQFEADFDGPRLKFSGMAKLDVLDGQILADISGDKLPVARIKEFWPVKLLPMTREWITTNITDGEISDIKGAISLSLNEIYRRNIKKDSIDFSFELNDGRLSYSPQFPEVTDLEATLKFDALGADFTVRKATQNALVLTEPGSVKIPSFRSDPILMKIEAKANGPATELASIYSKVINENPTVLQASLDSITGDSENALTLAFSLEDFHSSELALTLDTKLKDITLDGLLGHGKLTQGNLDLSINNSAVAINGTGMINTIPTIIQFEKELEDLRNKPYTSKYLFKSHISSDELKNLNLPSLPFIKNKFILAASIEEHEGKTDFVIHSDFKESEIDFPELQWTKSVGEEAKLDIEASLADNNTLILKRFIIASNKLNSRGSGFFTTIPEQRRKVVIDSLVVGETNIHGELDISDTRYQLKVKGPSLDISHLPLMEMTSQKSGEKKHVLVEAQIGKVKTQHDGLFFNVAGHLQCAITGCFSASLSATMPNKKYFDLAYQPIGANLQDLKVNSDNAGEILRVFGVMQHIKDGNLSVNAEMHINPEDTDDKKLIGDMLIEDFYAIKTPVLAKLMTVASLTGVMDLLNGKGIPFKKFTVPFIKRDDSFEIKEAKGHGASVGLTIKQGIINTADNSINLKGTIIPAYTVNNFLGKVLEPLGAGLLTSGDGQGVLGTTYSVSGSTKNPDVSINPLSTITPAFIKGIFELKDPPPPPANDIQPQSGEKKVPVNTNNQSTTTVPSPDVETNEPAAGNTGVINTEQRRKPAFNQ